jgi:hypothetical protein
MNSKKAIQNVFWACLLTASSLTLQGTATEANKVAHSRCPYANKTNPDKTDGNKKAESKCPFGSRRASEEEKADIQASRQAEASENEQASKSGAIAKCFSMRDNGFKTSALHSINDVFVKDRSLDIENGASFTIRDWDVSTVATWMKGSPIRITPNHSWTTSYEYCLTHQVTGSVVQATLTRGPLELSPYNRRIAQLNKITGELVLDNGEYYAIGDSGTEREMLSKWEPNDIVIIGDNDSWFSFSYKNILINIATDNWVTAARIQ